MSRACHSAYTAQRSPAGRTALTATCLLAASLSLADTRINFTTRVNVPDIGLSLQLMSRATAMPSPSPRVYRYKVTQGVRNWEEERFDPHELWVADQQLGAWIDDEGTTVRLASPKLDPLGDQTTAHITREDYNIWARTAKRDDWDKQRLAFWLGAFLQIPTPELVTIRTTSMRIYRAYSIQRPQHPSSLCYLILPRYEPSFSRKHGKPWILFDITLPAHADREGYARNAERNLIGTMRPLPSSFFMQHARDRWDTPAPPPTSVASGTPAYEHSKQMARASIRNLEDWWFDETRYYIILSNLRSQRKKTIEELRDHMDLIQEAYRELIPAWAPITQVSVLRAFQEPTEYRNYVGEELAWSDGVWIPARRELVIRPAANGNNRERHETMLKIVRHEGFHQYLFYALDKVETCPWFNEGHASLFESAEEHRTGLRILEDPVKCAILVQLAQTTGLKPSRLFQLSYPQFYGNNEATRRANYAEAWGLIYYLRKESPQMRPDRFSRIIPTYLQVLKQSKNGTQATRKALEGVDLQALDTDFSDFWISASRRSRARRK